MKPIRVFTEEEKNQIINLYSSGEISNKHSLGKLFKTSHVKINNILVEAGLDLDNLFKTASKMNYTDYITQYEGLLTELENYMAVCKKTGKEYLDYSNTSGVLSRHILELYPDVVIPSSFKRRNYLIDNNRFWHEEYFTISKKNKGLEPIKVSYDSEIVRLYSSKEVDSTHKLGEMFKMGHKKISEILRNNGVVLNKRGAKVTHGLSGVLSENKIIKHISYGKVLVAKCKKTGIVINDPNNLSGSLTNHLVKVYGDSLEIPSNTYQRKKYELDSGEKWFNDYFDMVETDKCDYRKCGLCDWETEDVLNKTGCFENHIVGEHDIPIDDYLTEFPEDIKYHKSYNIKILRNDLFLDSKNFITCKLCGEKLKIISNTHLTHKHNITCEDYKILYPNEKLVSDTSNHLNIHNYLLGNINMKPTWTSKGEIEVKEFIEGMGFDVEKSRNRKLLNGKEIDLIIPSIKLGIEYNGLYYHTEKMGKHSTYHLNKTLECNSIGYKLIHIFEDEWINNKELVKNKLKHLLNINNGIKIGGRSVIIKEIESVEKTIFLNENHIQGNDKSKISYGAYYKNKLVGVMTFKNERNMTKTNDGEYELSRYATKQGYIISGLASKILKQFINSYSPKTIISFADRRWSLDAHDNLYIKIGFKFVGIIKPDYKYFNSKIARNKRLHKFGFGKNALKNKYPNLDFTKTEKQLTTELGYDRIWDCGLFKYELTI